MQKVMRNTRFIHYSTRGAVQRNDNSIRFFNAHKKKKLRQKRVCSLCVSSFVSVIVIITAAAGSFVPFLPTTVSENLKT